MSGSPLHPSAGDGADPGAAGGDAAATRFPVLYEHLSRLVDDGPLRGIAFHPSGSWVVPVPPEVRHLVDEVAAGGTPLDLVVGASMADAVLNFELARRHGTSCVELDLVDGRRVRMTIIDAEDEGGIFLAVTTPVDDPRPCDGVDDADLTAALRPRRITAELSGPTGVVASVDDAFLRRLGWERDELIGMGALDLVHPDDRDECIGAWARLIDRPGGEVRARIRYATVTGDSVWFESTFSNRLDTEGVILAELVDVTDEMEAVDGLRRREALLARMAEALPSGVLQIGADGTILFSNPRWWEITGLSPDSTSLDLRSLIDGRTELTDLVRSALVDRRGGDVQMVLAPVRGRPAVVIDVRVRPMDEPAGLIVVIDDVTAAATVRAELLAASERDELTGVLNRRGIRARLTTSVEQRAGAPLSVLFCDVDELKAVNDELGHAVGDRLLRSVARTLGRVLRGDQWLGRLGGDEFLVVLDGTDEATASHLARELEAALDVADPFADGRRPSISIGVASAADGDAADDLVERADARMYLDKQRRRLSPTVDA